MTKNVPTFYLTNNGTFLHNWQKFANWHHKILTGVLGVRQFFPPILHHIYLTAFARTEIRTLSTSTFKAIDTVP